MDVHPKTIVPWESKIRKESVVEYGPIGKTGIHVDVASIFHTPKLRLGNSKESCEILSN